MKSFLVWQLLVYAESVNLRRYRHLEVGTIELAVTLMQQPSPMNYTADLQRHQSLMAATILHNDEQKHVCHNAH